MTQQAQDGGAVGPVPATVVVEDEPDLLRDQFRQLLRYPRLIAGGVLIGLLGGAWLGYSTSDTYVATSDVVLRVPVEDPFNPSIAVEKTLDMNTERQAATSRRTAERAAEELGYTGEPSDLLTDLQVTNPPKSLVLRFAYTSDDPAASAERANALVEAYLADRREQTEHTRDTMIKGLQQQLDPVAKRHDELAEKLEGRSGSEVEADYTVKANLLNRMTELSNRISKLKALDMTPGKVLTTATPPASSDGPGWPLSLVIGGGVSAADDLLIGPPGRLPPPPHRPRLPPRGPYHPRPARPRGRAWSAPPTSPGSSPRRFRRANRRRVERYERYERCTGPAQRGASPAAPGDRNTATGGTARPAKEPEA